MKEFLTPEIIAIVVVAAMVVVAVFFAIVANKIAGIDGKVTELTEDIHKRVEKNIEVLAEGLHDEARDRGKVLEDSLGQMGDSWRNTLDKTVSDVRGEIGKLKGEVKQNSDELNEKLTKIIVESSTDVNEQMAQVRDNNSEAMQAFHSNLAQQVREHAKGEQETLNRVLDEISSSFGKNISDLAENQGKAIEDLSATVGEGLKSVAEKASSDMGSVSERIDSSISSSGKKLEEDLSAIGKRVGDDLESITKRVSTGVNDVSKDLTRNVTAIADRINLDMASVTGKLDQSVDDVSRNLDERMASIGEGVNERLDGMSTDMGKGIKDIGTSVDENLDRMGSKIDERIHKDMKDMLEVFETFAGRVDAIEKTREQIISLAENVNVLAQVLDDRRARGNIGEVLIESIVMDNLTPSDYELGATLSNGRQVDCLLKLPKPSGHVAINTKVDIAELETISSTLASSEDREKARRRWHEGLQEAIRETAAECIIEGETAAGAILLLPSESAFSEAHINHRDLVDDAYKHQVWLASPSTLIAMVTVARSVIKDATARRELEEARAIISDVEKGYKDLEDRFKNVVGTVDDLLSSTTETRKRARRIGDQLDSANVVLSRSSEHRIAHSQDDD